MPLSTTLLHLESYRAVVADLESKRDKLNELINWLRNFYEPITRNEPTTVADEKANFEVFNRRAYERRPKIKNVDKDLGNVAATVATIGSDKPIHTGRPSPVQDAILEVLSKNGALTSIECLGELEKAGVKSTAASVYATLHLLAQKGGIDRVTNDEGRIAWKLKQTKQANS